MKYTTAISTLNLTAVHFAHFAVMGNVFGLNRAQAMGIVFG